MNKPPSSIHTAGGAVVSGDVNAGTFIGRDQIIVISGYTSDDLERLLDVLRSVLASGQADLCADVRRGRLRVTAPDAPPILLSSEAARDLMPVAGRRADESAYLTALQVNPRYGRWAVQFVPLAGILTTFERPPGWTDIPPEFTLLEVHGEGPGRQVRRIRLDDITQATDRHDALVILGEPGAGKTTVLYKLALDAARHRLINGKGRIPLYLSLADYRDYPSPFDFVQAVWRQHLGKQDLTDRLREGGLLLLVDALNEMPFRDDRDYRERVGAWRRFVSEWPGNQVLFTCRSRDYGEPLGLHQVEIERLDDGRVREFLERYLAEDLAREAWERLRGDPLLDLVRNPYYLSMLAYILAGGGAWPANRAALFREFVGFLLTREQSRGHLDWPGKEVLEQALSGLAESIQPMGQGTRLARREMLARIPAQVEGPEGPAAVEPSVVLRLGLAATLLDAERPPEGEEKVRFYHHQLQEYFAARALLARFRAGEDLSGRWRQPRLAREMPDAGPLGPVDPLPPPPPTGWEEPTVLAAGLAPDPSAFVEAVRRVNPVLAARCLNEGGITPLPEVKERVRDDLRREIEDRCVHLRARIAAGEALGRLGDPRFAEMEIGGQRVVLPPLVHIPAGPFRMGSTLLHVLRLALRGFIWALAELPRHTVDLPEFYIGRFPVTNREFACFVEAGGYEKEQYWPTPAARAWLRGEGESGALKTLMDTWQTVRENPALLTQLGRAGWNPAAVEVLGRLIRMDEAEVREMLGKIYAERPRHRPAFWDDERFSNPSQPVVGVTWYEAAAYCNWLGERLREAGGRLPVWRGKRPETLRLDPHALVVRLPTEAEWEKAARTNRGWVYPWGNRWDAGRANTWEGHVLRPTPVGIYPDGATPEGIHDLAGNVWEWTGSRYRPYPYRADDGREDLEGEGPWVVRGGSWDDDQRLARCACRVGLVPDYWNYSLGFRVVVSLALRGSDF
jgi:formylglycine-generating enzyme required for sulfatase activity